MDGLMDLGHQTYVVTPQENRFTDALSELRIPYRVIPLDWWMALRPFSLSQELKWIVRLFTSLPELKKTIKEWNIDLIYTNTSVIPAGRFSAFLLRKPHIWHIREFGDLDFSLKFIFSNQVCKKIIASSQAVICNSKAVQNHFFDTPSDNIHLVYNGSVTKTRYDQLLEQQKTRTSNSPFTFAMVSLISPKKGQYWAIKAMAELKKSGLEAKLIIAGHGKQSYVQSCMELAEELDVSDKVLFTGFIDDPYTIYLSADCILICSENEALSRVALEAMACGAPLIARDSGGNPEIFEHEKTGLLFNDFDELVDCMIKAVKDPGWIKQIGYAGWQSAKDKFTIENYSSKVNEIINAVLTEESRNA